MARVFHAGLIELNITSCPQARLRLVPGANPFVTDKILSTTVLLLQKLTFEKGLPLTANCKEVSLNRLLSVNHPRGRMICR